MSNALVLVASYIDKLVAISRLYRRVGKHSYGITRKLFQAGSLAHATGKIMWTYCLLNADVSIISDEIFSIGSQMQLLLDMRSLVKLAQPSLESIVSSP